MADTPNVSVERHREPTDERAGCPVVGVGASAGGRSAFRRLLPAMHDDPGMAFVFAEHLPTGSNVSFRIRNERHSDG